MKKEGCRLLLILCILFIDVKVLRNPGRGHGQSSFFMAESSSSTFSLREE
jgi:hypothetical protein